MACYKRRRKADYGNNEKLVYQNKTYDNIPEEFKLEFKVLFNKKFKYEITSDISSLSGELFGDNPSWSLPELQMLKEKLNAVKSKLNDYELSNWHEHTQKTNTAGLVISHLRRNFHPEMCTQAWCKFYEIVASYNIIPNTDELYSVHLCEAPGAFVTSLNQYIKSEKPNSIWNWIASTLNPYYEGNNLHEMIDDDRFICDSLDNWCFGADDTGDLLNLKNIHFLQEKAKNLGKISVVTADGSIDCQHNPGEQEIIVSHLHSAEVAAALTILEEGGSFVIKMFTMFEDVTLSLLYVLNGLFKEMHAFKPGTSKAGNSEVYLIFLNFKGITSVHLQKLLQLIGCKGPLLKKDVIPEEFIRQHVECCEQFVKYQMDTIEQNIVLFQKAEPNLYHTLDSKRAWCAIDYVHRYKLRGLKADEKLVHHEAENSEKPAFCKQTGQYNRKRHCGTYSQRKDQAAVSWSDRLQQLSKSQIQPLYGVWWRQVSGNFEGFGHQPNLTLGKPLKRVLNSKFLSTDSLSTLTELLTKAQCLVETDHQENGILIREDWEEVIGHITSVSHQPNTNFQLFTSCDKCDSDIFVSQLAPFLIQQNYAVTVSAVRNTILYNDGSPGSAGRTGIGVFHADLSRFQISDILNGDQYGTVMLKSILPLLQVGLVHNGYDISQPAQMVFVGLKKKHISYELLIKNALEKINYLEGNTSSQATLLQFVPIHWLFEQNFYSHVCEWNQWIVDDRINKIIDKEILLQQKLSS